MRIALIADVHGNWPALRRVLRHAGMRKADVIWNLGDLIGYGPFPEKVIDTLRRARAVSIVGNYDLKVLAFKKKKAEWQKSKHPAKFFSFGWTHERLSAKTKIYLRKLPPQKRIMLGETRFLLVHGSPEKIDDRLEPQTPNKKFSALAKKVKADVVLCGHTHRFFAKQIGGVRFINPGAVGRPVDGNPKTSYALIDLKGKDITVRNYRLNYNLREVVTRMKREGFPEELCRSIRQARNF